MIRTITIDPELPIGTEFWMLVNGKARMGLVASFEVRVTSCINKNNSWYEQLWTRWMNRDGVDKYIYSFTYHAKLDQYIELYDIRKNKHGKWELLDKPIFFSLDELRKSIK